VTKAPTVLHDIDATKAFNLAINGIALLAPRSIGFQESVTTMICKTWSGRKCHLKTAFGVSTRSYRSILEALLYGLGQGNTSSTDIWGILHILVMYALALSFTGILILILSITKRLQHEWIGKGFIDDTGLVMTNTHSKAITPTSKKTLTNEERELHTKANGILQFFLNLLNVIG
jgi:hypothetical protein